MHRFAHDQGELELSAMEVLGALGAHGLIRIQRWESSRFAAHPELWHFNLGRSTHVPWERYGLVRILKSGRRLPGEAEVHPLLDPADIRLATALRVEHVTSLAKVPEEWLRPSSLPMTTRAGLAASLAAKYAKTNEGLSEAIELHGITATLLRQEEAADLSATAPFQRAAARLSPRCLA